MHIEFKGKMNPKEGYRNINLEGDTIKEEEEDSKVRQEEDSIEEEDRLFSITVIRLGIQHEIVPLCSARL
jgi:hypothetical protein